MTPSPFAEMLPSRNLTSNFPVMGVGKMLAYIGIVMAIGAKNPGKPGFRAIGGDCLSMLGAQERTP